MIVFGHWKGKTGRIAGGGIETKTPFHDPPPVVGPTGTADGLKIYFFAHAVANIRDVIVPRLPIKGGPERITQPACPDFGPSVRGCHIRITWRNGVGGRVARFHVDPQKLTAQDAQILCQIILMIQSRNRGNHPGGRKPVHLPNDSEKDRR